MTNPTSHHDDHDHRDHRDEGKTALVAPPKDCPGWCVTHHALHLGEEDWVHTGEPLIVAEGLAARLCMSIHPATGDQDGPYVLIGTSELTLDERARLGASLLSLVNADGGGVRLVAGEQLEGAVPVLDA